MTAPVAGHGPEKSPRREHHFPLLFLVMLGVIGVLLVATTIAAPFTVDEDNYLVTVVALRSGGVALANTAGLPNSDALLWFDPAFTFRPNPPTPVVSTAPPLYAPLAVGFSFLGWRGLAALNTLAFLIAIALVFRFTQSFAERRATPWIAAAAFSLGGFAFEYAQGVWPHMLAVALTFSAFVAAAKARTEEAPRWAALAGLLVGLAAGVRFQNIVFAAALGGGLWLFARRRWRTSAYYGLGLGATLAVAALINRARISTLNPVTKGGTYTHLGGVAAGSPLHGVVEALRVVWSMVVDYRVRPPIGGPGDPWHWSPNALGVFIYDGVVRKAWLQSSPWIAVALFFGLAVWFRRGQGGPRRNEARALGLIIVAVLGLFGLAGFGRHAGLCYNARYLFELTPLAAVLLAWASEELPMERQALLAGALLGLGLAAAGLGGARGGAWRTWTLIYAPFALAVAFLAAWMLYWMGGRGGRAAAVMLAACIAWGLGVHLGDDLPGARHRRTFHLRRLEALRDLPTGPTALMSVLGFHVALGPLLLDHDVVIANPGNDRGRTEHALVEAWFRQGRRVFLDGTSFPRKLLGTLSREWRLEPVGNGALIEVFPRG